MLALLAYLSLCGNSPTLDKFAAVGSHVKSALQVAGVRRGPCTPTDCELLMQDGSRWTVFGQLVTRQRYLRSEAGKRMPFGLNNVVGRQQSLKRLSALTGVKFRMANDRRIHDGSIKLQGGTEARLYFRVGRRGYVEEIGVTIGEGE